MIGNLLDKIFRKGFPKYLTEIWPYYHQCYKSESPYTVDLWTYANDDWYYGGMQPMLKKNGYIAYYRVIFVYYRHGDSMSDWGGVDGRNRDFKFHKVEKVEQPTKNSGVIV